MSQFTVYKNRNSATRARVPFLLDVQSDLLSELDTRMVIPLYATVAWKGKTLSILTPRLEIEGKEYVLMTPQMAGISKRELGVAVTNMGAHRNSIIASLDLLITGI